MLYQGHLTPRHIRSRWREDVTYSTLALRGLFSRPPPDRPPTPPPHKAVPQHNVAETLSLSGARHRGNIRRVAMATRSSASQPTPLVLQNLNLPITIAVSMYIQSTCMNSTFQILFVHFINFPPCQMRRNKIWQKNFVTQFNFLYLLQNRFQIEI